MVAASPRSWPGDLSRGLWAVRLCNRLRRFFRAKAQRFGANDGDVCGYRYPPGGVVVATCVAIGLRVKTPDHSGLDSGGVLRRYPLGGGVVEPCTSCPFRCLWWQVWFSLCFFFLSVICFVRGSPHHFVSVRPLCFIYKAGRKPISSYLFLSGCVR